MKEDKRKLSDSMQEWLEVFKYPTIQRNTYDGYESNARNYIFPHMGVQKVRDITPIKIKRLFNAMMERGLAYSTTQKTRLILNEFFRYMERSNRIEHNPMKPVPPIKRSAYESAQGKKYKAQTDRITYSDTETIASGWTGSKEITLSLGLNESVTFTNTPDGVTYPVKENNYSSDGYEIPTYTFDNASETGDTVLTGTDWSGVYASGSISDSADTVTYKNKKSATIDVGVVIENAPFVIIILLVIGLAVFMIIKRRRRIED